MKLAPIFRDAYEVDETDLDGLVDNIKSSDDDMVADALIKASRYTGMAVTQTSATAVMVANGRLWVPTGQRYYSDEAGGFPLDLSSQKPGIQNRVVLIVAYGEEIPTDLEYRDYETDATTQTKEPRQVNVKTYRHVRLEAVPGAEAVSPAPPVVSSALTIATVVMSPAGITSIVQNNAALLDNLQDVATRTSSLEDWRETTDPKIASITSDLAALRNIVDGLGSNKLPYALAADVAELKLLAKLPATYTNYRADDFFDATYSNILAPGYAAKTEEGLRFPAIALNDSALALANAYDATVVVSGSGLLLPKYNEGVQRIVAGGVGTLALSQYAYETRTSTILTMSMARVRYGDEFEESTGSDFFLSGQFLGVQNPAVSAASIFLLNGQTYQVTNTGEVDPDGHQIVRLQKFWTDTTGAIYWSRVNTDQPIIGFAWTETFVQKGDAWVTAVSVRVTSKPGTGMLYVGYCECTDGEPDLDKMLFLVGQDATYWTPGGGIGYNKVPVPPTLLSGGTRYGYVLMTAADYYVQVVETGTSPTTGTLFYGLNGGIWESDPNRHIMFDMWTAAFPNPSVAVEFAGQNLSGGIASLDILNGQAVPASCSITWQVFINGGPWQSLGEADTSLFASLPPYARLRALLTGTQDVMPGINMGASRVRVSRPGTAVKHVSVIETLGTPSSTIVVKSTLKNFDPAHHTHAVKIFTGVGLATSHTATTVVDVVRDDTTERTSTFSLGSAVTSYQREIDEITDSATNLFVCSNVTDIAE